MKQINVFKSMLFSAFLLGGLITQGQTYVVLTASGTWTVPAGVTSVTIGCYGGGGGGGGANNSSGDAAGGGGGGGAYSTQTLTVIPGQIYTVTIGSGGTGGSGSGGNGSNGNITTFTGTGGTCSAAGGTGGLGATLYGVTGGIGGNTGTGLLYNGGTGGTGEITSFDYGGGGGGGAGNSSVGSDGVLRTGGNGGTGTYPGGKGANGTSSGGTGSGSTGSTGTIPGGGGSGAAVYMSTNKSGGSGARGQIVLSYIPCVSPTISSQPNSPVICNGSTATLSVTASGNAPMVYQWQLMASNCASPSPVGTDTSSYTTAALAAGTYYYSCNINNVCGTLTSNCGTITVSAAIPTTPGSISGGASQCSGVSGQVYSIAAIPGTLTYNWTLPTGWTITNGANTNSITVSLSASAQSGNVSVTAANGCGTSAASTTNVTVNTTPVVTASNNGPVCVGFPIILTGEPTAMSVYSWTGPNSFVNGTPNPTVSSTATMAMAGTYTLTVISPNSCSSTASTTVVMVAAVPAQPSIISGSATPSVGSSQNYSVTNVPGTTYTWTFPSDWNQTSGGNTNSVMLTIGTLSGSVTVVPSNTCGSGLSQTMTVTALQSTPYTTSGTWQCPAGVYSVIAECWGGGGAGGAGTGNPANGGGGAGGAYSSSVIGVTPLTIYNVTVGSAKTSATTNTALLNTGNPSWFVSASTLFAAGGEGGAPATAASSNGIGGTGSINGSIGYIIHAGGNGASGDFTAGVPGGAGGGGAGSSGVGSNALAGVGGSATVNNGGAGANGVANSTAGAAGAVYGGGGSGGKANTATDRNGGSGAAGYVIITANTIYSYFTATTLNVFDSVCVNTTTGPNSVTITGTDLTNQSVTVAALSGYSLSTTATGTYTSTLTFPQSGGSFSQIVYVKFTPTLPQSYNGNISVGGGGAPSLNVAVVGAGKMPAMPGTITSNSPQCFGTGITFTKGSCTGGTCYWVSSATGMETTNSAATYTTPSTAGNYTVWVRGFDGACWGPAISASGLINNIPTAPTVGTITQPTCMLVTGSVVIWGLPTNGQWTLTRSPGGVTTLGNTVNTTLTLIPPGTYTFRVTDTIGCTSVASANVLINSPPAVPATPTITQVGNTLHSDATFGNQWYNQSGLIFGATSQNYTITANGTYYNIVKINGCSSDTSNIIIITNVGVTENEINKDINVYPNPVSNELIIEIKGSTLSTDFEIVNTMGQVVFKGKMIEKTRVETSAFAPGVYMIKLENGKTLEFKKIIKE